MQQFGPRVEITGPCAGSKCRRSKKTKRVGQRAPLPPLAKADFFIELASGDVGFLTSSSPKRPSRSGRPVATHGGGRWPHRFADGGAATTKVFDFPFLTSSARLTHPRMSGTSASPVASSAIRAGASGATSASLLPLCQWRGLSLLL